MFHKFWSNFHRVKVSKMGLKFMKHPLHNMSIKRSYEMKNKLKSHDSISLFIFSIFFDFALKSVFELKHANKIVHRNNKNLFF